MARLIPVSEWAAQLFGEHAPHRNTLSRWARTGQIMPLPVKIGKHYYVKPTAQYYHADANKTQNKIERMTSGSPQTNRR